MAQHQMQHREKIYEKLERLRMQKRDVISQKKKCRCQRKARSRQLIQIGKLSENYFQLKHIQPADYENFLQKLLSVENIGEWILFVKQKTSSAGVF